jgi:hypothetical protein
MTASWSLNTRKPEVLPVAIKRLAWGDRKRAGVPYSLDDAAGRSPHGGL